MLNIVFSRSAEGCLRLSRRELDINHKICALELYLHVGNIKAPLSVKDRRQIFDAQGDWCAEYIAHSVKKFKKSLSHDSKVCLWFSKKCTDEYLGFLFVVDYLKDKRYEIYYHDLTEEYAAISYMQDDEITNHNISGPVRLSDEEIKRCSDEWQRIANDKAELRLSENSEIKLLPIDYYDKIIYEIAGSEPVRVSKICGEMLSMHTPFLLVFVLYRVKTLVDESEFTVIEEGCLNKEMYGENVKDFMHSIIQRNTDQQA